MRSAAPCARPAFRAARVVTAKATRSKAQDGRHPGAPPGTEVLPPVRQARHLPDAPVTDLAACRPSVGQTR